MRFTELPITPAAVHAALAAARGAREVNLFEGVRVLDLSRMLAGPYGSHAARRHGRRGDQDRGARRRRSDARHGAAVPARRRERVLPRRSTATRSRSRSTSAAPAGREVFLDLARHADVVWENFRPGIMERLGLALRDAGRRSTRGLVVCSISAYGQDGPYRDWPAFDLALQAMGGAMSLTGEPGGRPARMGLPMGDLAGGMFGAFAVAGALFRRERTGRGSARRPLAARLPGLAAHLHRAVLLDRRPRAGADGLRPRLGRAVPGAGHARRPPDRRGLRREVLGRVLPRASSAPEWEARPAVRPNRDRARPPRGADAAGRAGRSASAPPRTGSRACTRPACRPRRS